MTSDWVDPAPERPVPFGKSLKADIIAHVPVPLRNGSAIGWIRITVSVLIRSSGIHVAILYRLSYLARMRLGVPGRILAAVLSWFMRHVYSCSIDPTSRIQGGLMLPHPQGIVIEPGVAIGPRTYVYQNVSIVAIPGEMGVPQLGSDSRIYTGAVLTGRIRLGDDVSVGANVVVAQDVPSRSFVRLPRCDFTKPQVNSPV
jgi:serine acetyltransferase